MLSNNLSEIKPVCEMHLDSQYGEKTSKRDACRLSMERKPLGETHVDSQYGEKTSW